MNNEERTLWTFEAHVAEDVFEKFTREHAIPVHRDEWLDRERGVKKSGGRIVSITTLKGQTCRGKVFIVATYEGDLMAAAGVDYHVGREPSVRYGEEWKGVQVGVLHHRHRFGPYKAAGRQGERAALKISPYVVPNDPSSGLLPRISAEPPGQRGEGDRRVQAYCYRMCLTDHPENRVPFLQPTG